MLNARTETQTDMAIFLWYNAIANAIRLRKKAIYSPCWLSKGINWTCILPRIKLDSVTWPKIIIPKTRPPHNKFLKSFVSWGYHSFISACPKWRAENRMKNESEMPGKIFQIMKNEKNAAKYFSTYL